MPEKLFSLVESEGILVDFFPLPADILGVYYHVGDKPPVILLHSKLKNERRLQRCILAEELGHHFTTGANLIAFARSQKTILYKYEKIAQLWAVKLLIPANKLKEALNSGIVSTHELAEHFDVTERFMGTGIQFYKEKYVECLEKDRESSGGYPNDCNQEEF